MKKFYATLLATSFLFSLNTYASTTVTSFQGLTDALASTDADVIFDASGIENVEGRFSITEDQTVHLKNILSWTNPDPTTRDNNRIITNEGVLSIENANFNNNKLWIGNGASTGGGVIKNTATITKISNVAFNNNAVKTDVFSGIKGGHWGSVILNYYTTGFIDVIEDCEFLNNTAESLKNAPHGVGIVNTDGARINLINNVRFENNTMKSSMTDDAVGSGVHSGIIDNNDSSFIGTISNSVFINNKSIKQIKFGSNGGHASGGVLHSYSVIEKIENVLFERNAVITYDPSSKAYAGAVKNVYDSPDNPARMDIIKNVDFIGNYAEHTQGSSFGGAFAATGQSSTQEMREVLFKDNYAQGDGLEDGSGEALGGGMYHRGGTIGLLNGEFTGNHATSKYGAARGGAIWNSGTLKNINDSKFIGNYATGGGESLGGAIYNTGDISFSGTTVFKGNKAGNKLNDIHNDGSMSISGDITLDGGITGTGSITFKEGASLNATLNQTTILADSVTFEGGNQLSFVIGDDIETKTYDFIEATLTGNENVSITENPLYTLALTQSGDISVTKKSVQDVQGNLAQNMDEKSAEIITTVLMAKGNEKLSTLSDEFSKLVQNNSYGVASKGAKELAPTNSALVSNLSKSTTLLLLNAIENKNKGVGRAGGDAFKNASIWMKALYSNAEQEVSSSTEGFEVDTNGFVLGVDNLVRENLILGAGYAYLESEAEAGARDIDVEGHNVFAYAKYQPNQWYVNGMVSYGQSKYKERKTPLENVLRSEYDVKTYGATVMTGYHLEGGLTPEVGLRYLLIDQEGYFDGAQEIHVGKTDFLTAVIGAQFETFISYQDWVVSPNVSLHATYDLISDDSVFVVSLENAGSYKITGENDDRFGIEGALGVKAMIDNIDVSLNYLGGFKEDYQNHSGMLNIRYHF